MRVVLGLLSILFLFAACSENEATIPIQKMETADKEAASIEMEPDLLENEETGKINEFLEFMIEDEIISISISEIPILNEYLQAQQNSQQAIENMELEKYEAAFEQFYMLQFSCHDEHCSHFLLHPDKNKAAFLVADIARYETFAISPDETKIAFLFSRMGEQDIPLGNIVVFDLMNWAPVALYNHVEEVDMLGFRWPIITIEWKSDESIAISFPDLIEPNKESWDAWSATEENSKITVIYHIQ